MSEPNQPGTDPAGLRGPGSACGWRASTASGSPGQAGNIREEQQTQAAGTAPAAYVGSGDSAAEDKPEDSADTGMWDDET